MSATVKLSSKLPGDPEINGLDAYAEHLLNEPDELLVAIVYFDSPKELVDHEADTRVPVARIRRVEPLGTIPDVPQAVRDAMADAEGERTGRTPLPFEIVVPPKRADPDGDPFPEGDE